jgi:D-lactate dehydrogenase
MIDQKAFAQTKKGVMLINTGRGALIETRALIGALKSGHVGFAGLDVCEEEEKVFFQDLDGAAERG